MRRSPVRSRAARGRGLRIRRWRATPGSVRRSLAIGIAGAALLAEAFPGARAASLDGELAFDFLRAASRNDGPGAGRPARIGAQDLGMLFRVNARDGRFSVAVDYRGREAFGGDVRNSDLRLLYAGWLRYEVVPAKLDVTAGRFLAPSVVLLPVDAVSATLKSGAWTASAFGGRRGILTSRRNVPLDEYLPAAGASLTWRRDRLRVNGVVAYSEDEAILLQGRDETKRRWGAWNGSVDAWLRPIESISITGRLSLAERASWVLGPGWTSVEVDVEALDLFHGNAFVEWRPHRDVRLGYDVHTQRASVFRTGLLDAVAGFAPTPVDEPRFTDHRFRTAWRARGRAWSVAWLRGELRVRLRPERREERYGVSIDADDLGGGPLGLEGRIFHDRIDPKPGRASRFDRDRTFYSGALTFRRSRLDFALGASRLEREAAPYSGRPAVSPSSPGSAEDLGLFTLETESIAFARVFHVRGRQFGGLDVELNLEDTGELRFFVQLGTRWENGE